MTRQLLILTALVEATTGAALLFDPTRVAGLLLGASLDAPAALIVARVAGVALLSLGVGCWLARGEGHTRAVRAWLVMMLLYNAVAGAVLTDAGLRIAIAGPLLWPAVALHAALAVWCFASLRRPANAVGA